MDEPKQKRALTNVGGPARRSGESEASERLAHALDVPTSAEAEEEARAHLHGFHSYPARMHPITARRLVEAFSRADEAILDPFCGSGTVLLEARLLHRHAFGVDANPLAVRLAELKVRGSSEGDRARLVAAARTVAARADERRKAKTGASRRYPPPDMALFAPHVLFELDGLRVGLDELEDKSAARDLELVLSSILTKVGKKSSDTSDERMERRIAAGYPARLFVKKAEELSKRLAEVAPVLGRAPLASVRAGDSRALGGVPKGAIAAVITSPPYPGNYDYLTQHETRLRWLRLDARPLERAEIGARRHLEPLGPRKARARWVEDLAAVVQSILPTLHPKPRLGMLVADSVAAGEAIYALDVFEEVARATGLRLVAAASQARPHFHGPSARAFAGRPREEHLVLLGAGGAPGRGVPTKGSGRLPPSASR